MSRRLLLNTRKSAIINHASALHVFILCCMSTRLCLILQWRAESWQAFHPKIAKLSTFREMQKNTGTTKTACPLLSNHASLNPNLCPAAVDPIRLVLFFFGGGVRNWTKSHASYCIQWSWTTRCLFFFCGPATFIQRCSALKSHQTPDFSRSLVGKAKKKKENNTANIFLISPMSDVSTPLPLTAVLFKHSTAFMH